MKTVRPFQISISKETLVDLQNRLKNARWTTTVKDAGWDYGTEMEYLKGLTAYWQHGYNWRKQEKELNKLNHFKSKIEDYDIHFIHQHGKGPNPRPILLLHG